MLGKPISTDKLTGCKERISYARALMEVDASVSLVRSVRINFPNGPYDQPIFFEHEPNFCSTCKVFGHSSQNCSLNKKEDLDIVKDFPVANNQSLVSEGIAATVHEVTSEAIAETNHDQSRKKTIEGGTLKSPAGKDDFTLVSRTKKQSNRTKGNHGNIPQHKVQLITGAASSKVPILEKEISSQKNSHVEKFPATVSIRTDKVKDNSRHKSS
ncbi:Uncharacterized protein Adt_06871 [Abeliophyllum distichum]|uniref:Zinc knuckle CX2CX4HX4C domain-containing protein n=1 Tax=Abeliophyllum distichum TaxID=126358 RepID=A0ABD1V852_9LAMI